MKKQNLIISGDSSQQSWDIEDVLKNDSQTNTDLLIERMMWYEYENKRSKYEDGMTYYEIEQLNNFCK